MNVTLRIPDDFAERLGGGDIERLALEALAAEAFRAGRLGKAELRELLGLEGNAGVDAFLHARDAGDTVAFHAADTPAEFLAEIEKLALHGA